MPRSLAALVAFLVLTLLAPPSLRAQRQMESLGRGLIVLRTSSTQTYVGWRLLGNDPEGIAFNLYRSANGGTPVKLNASPLAATTDYVDTPGSGLGTIAYTYSILPVLNGVEAADAWANPSGSSSVTLPVNAPLRQYIPVAMQPTPDDAAAGVSYTVKFCWVGDFDGDGEYDFLVDRTNPNVDAKQWLQAYKRDGTFLWQMDMGPNSVDHYNITPGSSSIGIGHGDNVTVYDLDGDGKAEVVVRTANGVVFSNGSTLSAPDNDAQYISILDALTGAEKARAPILLPAAWPTRTRVNGHMGVVYADGLRPSLFFQAANRNPDDSFNKYAATWDYRDGALTARWTWPFSGHSAEGHQIRLADVNNDGTDEYVDIGLVLKADGSGQINENVLTEVVHGDRFHITDIDPDRPGLETYLIQQNNGSGLATAYHSADKGAVIKKLYASDVIDVGRGTVGGFVPTLFGLQMFSTFGGTYDAKGNQLYASAPFPPETIWWDGDLGREFLSTIGSDATSPGIDKFNTATGGTSRVLSLYSDPAAPGSPYNNYIAYGGRPQFWGDILGDWREELLCVASDNSELRIYTTRTPDSAKTYDGAAFRIPTLMHDPQYRIQATTKGYVQSSYPSYYLGYNMPPPPPSPMIPATLVWAGGAGASTWDSGSTAAWKNSASSAASTFSSGQTVRFDLSGNNGSPVLLSGALQPGDVAVYSPIDYTFDGSVGSLGGPMKLLKAGKGALRLTGSHAYTGATTVWDGALRIDGDLAGSALTVWGGTWGGAAAKGLTGGRLAGTGSVAQAVTLRYRGAVTPGAGMNSAGTLTLGAGLSARDGSVLAFDLSTDPSGTSSANDRLAITGALSLAGTVSLVINPLSGQLAPGTYTLATYTGALTGSAANLSVIVPDGTPYTVAVGSGALTLTIPVTRGANTVTWTGASSGAWDLANTPNWKLGGSPTVFVSGDTLTFDDTGSARPALTLNTVAPVAGITVSGSTNYTVSGSGAISGAGGLTKSGPGTLTLATANTFTGPVAINGGAVAFPSLSDAGEPGPLGASSAASSNLVLNGGALRLTGLQTSTNRNLTLGASGGAIDITSTGSSIQISGAIGGTGTLTKSGPGTLLLASANTYSGGTVLNGGKIYLAGATANANGLGTGPVTLNSGTLTMADVQASETAAWNLVVPAGASARLEADGRCSLTGSLTGSGDLTYYSPYVRSDLKGNWSAFAGRLFHVGGDLRFANTNGLAAAVLDLAAGTYAYSTINSSHTFALGSLSGSGNLAGDTNASRTVTWQIGARNVDTLFSGVIGNGTGVSALTKVGAGTLALSGAHTYTGATNVSAGKLLLSGGSLSGTAVTVSSGAAFGGNGSVTGNVTFNAGSSLLANPAAGPLAIAGNLSLGGTVTVSAAPGASLAMGTYVLYTYTGTLTGAPSFVWSNASYGATFDTSVAGRVSITITRGAADLVWTGAASANWNASDLNWSWTGGTINFQDSDRVRFDDTASVTAVTLPAAVGPAGIVIDSTKAYAFSGAGAISGAGSLTKSGTGTLTLSTAHAYTGGTTIRAGTVALANDTANASAFGTGLITLEGGTVQMNENSATNNATWDIVVPTGAVATLRMDQRINLSGSLSGSGTLNLYIPYIRATFLGDYSAFTGSLVVTTDSDGGDFRVGNTLGLPSAAIDLGNRVQLQYEGNLATTVPLGAVSGVAGAILTGLNNNNNAVGAYTLAWEVGGRGGDSTFSGAITDGRSPSVTALRKVGAGAWTLAGASTYTGATTVTAGALYVTGSLGTTAVSVSSGATLGGSGTLAGNLALASGARLALGVGASATRGLSVAGIATLDGAVTVVPALLGGTLAPGTYSLLTYTGAFGGSPSFSWLDTTGTGYTAVFDTATAGVVKITLSAPPALTPLESWRVTYFGTASATGLSADDADPDFDGRPNLLEYALATSPDAADPGPDVLVTQLGSRLALTFRRARIDLDYQVEASSDLAAWSVLALNPGAVGEDVTVTDAADLSAFPRRFLRLRVTLPAAP